MPALQRGAELLTERNVVAHEVARREHSRTDPETGERVMGDLPDDLAAVIRDNEEALDRLVDEVERRFGQGSNEAGLFAERLRALHQLLSQRYRLGDKAMPDSMKVHLRREIERTEDYLDEVESEFRAAVAGDDFDSMVDEVRNPEQFEMARQRAEELSSMWEGKSLADLIDEAKSRGITITRHDDFEDIIGKMAADELAFDPSMNPMVSLTTERQVRTLTFPDKTVEDLDRLLRIQGDLFMAKEARDAAKEALAKGEVKLRDLERRTDRVTPGQRLVLLRARELAARRTSNVREAREALNEQKQRLREARRDLTEANRRGIPAETARGHVGRDVNGNPATYSMSAPRSTSRSSPCAPMTAPGSSMAAARRGPGRAEPRSGAPAARARAASPRLGGNRSCGSLALRSGPSSMRG
jgi:hypothetical protein